MSHSLQLCEDGTSLQLCEDGESLQLCPETCATDCSSCPDYDVTISGLTGAYAGMNGTWRFGRTGCTWWRTGDGAFYGYIECQAGPPAWWKYYFFDYDAFLPTAAMAYVDGICPPLNPGHLEGYPGDWVLVPV